MNESPVDDEVIGHPEATLRDGKEAPFEAGNRGGYLKAGVREMKGDY